MVLLGTVKYAALNGHMEICEIILENVEDKNPAAIFSIENVNSCWTPLHCAASGGHMKIFMLIMNKIKKINPGLA